MLARYHALRLPQLNRHNGRLLSSRFRLYHSATAKFTTIDSNGEAVCTETGIMIGEPKESYVYVEPEVGNAMNSAIMRQLGWGARDTKTLPLRFHHDSRHFAHELAPLPRIDIPQNLPQNPGTSTGNVSPATLWLSGNWHAITIDGSPDESFERMSRESARDLRGALERLKDS